MDHTTKRPLRGFVLLGAVSLAVVAGAAVWLQAGWRSLGLQLTDRIGDGAQELQGFTLEGALQWRENFDALCFRLQDGAVVCHAIIRDDELLAERFYCRRFTLAEPFGD